MALEVADSNSVGHSFESRRLPLGGGGEREGMRMDNLANRINELLREMSKETDIDVHPERWAILCSDAPFQSLRTYAGYTLAVVVDPDCPPDRLYIIDKDYLPDSVKACK